MGMLVIVKDWVVIQDKKQNGAKHRQNLRGKPVCLLSTRHWEINSPFSRTIISNTSPNLHWNELRRRQLMFLSGQVSFFLNLLENT
jgi:hypothetical protein